MRRLGGCALVLLALASFAPGAPASAAEPEAPPVVDPQLRDQMDDAGPSGEVAAIVLFDLGLPYASGLSKVQDAGLEVNLELPAANAVYAFGRVSGLERLAADGDVARLQFPGKLPAAMETAAWATRSRALYEETGGVDLRVPAPGGGHIDGSGVGVAIIDSGVQAIHPDLDWCGDGPAATCKTVKNFKVQCPLLGAECIGPVVMNDVPDSDTTGGHGTHVAGISAASGEAGNGLYAGAAPGAKVYGFGSGEGLSIIIAFAAASFQWIIDNHADPLGNNGSPDPGDPADPPIKVINNSYGGAGAHDPDDVLARLANSAVDEGVTVVWAAGNDGGAGEPDECFDEFGNPVPVCTGTNANNPKAGNISVANYDDQGTGTRDGSLASSSSRGRNGDPETWASTWPDVSAPGTFITATCFAKPVCQGVGPKWPPHYDEISGTSMAAPHVAGVVALLHQANPSLTPPEVENILEDTAHKFTSGAAYTNDPANTDNSASFDKGHGLVDARRAVLRALGSSEAIDGEATPTTTVVADDDAGDVPTNDALDISSVSVSEDPATESLTVRFEVADASSGPTSDPFVYELIGSFDGRRRVLRVTWDGSAVTCLGGGPCTASLDGNAFVVTYGLGSLGVTRGDPLFDVWARSSSGGVTYDRIPGADPLLTDTHPERGEEHVFATAAQSAAECGDTLPVITDPQGDATQLHFVDSESFPSTPSLDVVSGRLTWDRSGEVVTFRIGVDDLTDAPPPGGAGKHYRFDFSYAGRAFEISAFSDDVAGDRRFDLSYFAGGQTDVTTTDIVALEGEFDAEANEIRVFLPVDVFNTEVARAFAAADPPRPAPPDMEEGSVLDAFTILAQRWVGPPTGPAATLTADEAGGVCSYTVGQDLGPSGDPLARDDTATTLQNTPVRIDVLANDVDTDGGTLHVTSVTTPENGTVTINDDDTVTYDPAADFKGADSFGYTVTDPDGKTDSATVDVTVENACPAAPTGAFADDLEPPDDGWTFDNSANFAPSVEWGPTDDPFASSPTTSFFTDAVGVEKDDRLVSPPFNLSAESHLVFQHRFAFEAPDADGRFFDAGVLEVSDDGGDTWVGVAETAFVEGGYNGRVVDAQGYALRDRPAWGGETARDEMGRVEVDLGAHAGDDVLLRWRFVSDSIGGDTGWWVDDVSVSELMVQPETCDLNRRPNAVDDRVTTKKRNVKIRVLANDTDPDGDPLRVIALDDDSRRGNGLRRNADGTITFRARKGFSGSDSFTYTVSDPAGLTDRATVRVFIKR